MVSTAEESNIKNMGKIIYINAPFNQALKIIKSNKSKIISMRDLACARIKKGKNSSLSRNGSFVMEGSLFIPNNNNKRIWLRESLILKNPKAAVEAHKKGREYFLPNDFDIDSFLDSVGKENYFILKDTSPISTNSFGKDARTIWAFQDLAKEYGKFLRDVGISNIDILMHNDNNSDEHINKQPGAFANQLWLFRISQNSNISGGSKDLCYNDRVRGFIPHHSNL